MRDRTTHKRIHITQTQTNTVLMLGFFLFTFACGTTQQYGVRSGFENIRLRQLVAVPFYTVSPFGLSDTVRGKIARTYEVQTSAWFRDHGVELLPSSAFWKAVDERESLRQELSDRLDLASPLSLLFEGDPTDPASLEATGVQLVTRSTDLPKTWLLGEIVYHSRGTCWERAVESDRARVVTESGDGKSPHLCIVTHFHARIIDATSGKTIWFGSSLVELRFEGPEETLSTAAIREAVRSVYSGPNGVEALVSGLTQAGAN
jgi:hypothetical protein